MKTTIQNKKQVLALARAYQQVALLLATEVAESAAKFLGNVEALTRIFEADVRDIYAIRKEAAKNHRVPVRRNR